MQKLDGPMGMSQTDYKAFLQGLKDARAAGYSGSIVDFYRQCRNNILAGVKTGEKTLHDLALSLGGNGRGSFAPVGRMAPPRAGSVRQRASGGVAPGLHGQRQAAAPGEALAPGGQGPGGTGYKAVLAQAKAQAAQAKQSRVAAGQSVHLRPGGEALSRVSFAPIGAGGLGPAARFAAQAGLLSNSGTPAQGETAQASTDSLAPSRASAGTASGGTPLAFNEAASTPPARADFARALESYFFRQSRLPPTGGAAFNPYLSPLWAGLKLPG